jgi:5-hydroxyisourate hydrolase
MKRISTHILDLMCGRPATHVPVRLERRLALGNWEILGVARTDRDGRCVQLLPEDELLAGTYRLSFETAAYFGEQNVVGLYPVVEVIFEVREGETEFHIPLLLSANGYTTYRGS